MTDAKTDANSKPVFSFDITEENVFLKLSSAVDALAKYHDAYRKENASKVLYPKELLASVPEGKEVRQLFGKFYQALEFLLGHCNEYYTFHLQFPEDPMIGDIYTTERNFDVEELLALASLGNYWDVQITYEDDESSEGSSEKDGASESET